MHYLFFTLFLLHLTSHTQVYYLSSCFISRRAAGTCPTVKSMYISLYSSSYCIRPALTWAISISAVERMEMVGPCLLGWRFGAANPFSAGPLSSFVASHSVSPNLKPIQPGGHVWRDCAFSPSAAWKQPLCSGAMLLIVSSAASCCACRRVCAGSERVDRAARLCAPRHVATGTRTNGAGAHFVTGNCLQLATRLSVFPSFHNVSLISDPTPGITSAQRRGQGKQHASAHIPGAGHSAISDYNKSL